jgi:flagellum-specific peptidoglycan hydrolase FlgJ
MKDCLTVNRYLKQVNFGRMSTEKSDAQRLVKNAPDYAEVEIEDDMTPQEFFESLSGPAKIASEQVKGIVPPSLILSLAAQESAYGKSKLAKEHNNFTVSNFQVQEQVTELIIKPMNMMILATSIR